MLNKLKILIIVTWKEEGRWFLYRNMKKHVKKIDVLHPYFKGIKDSLAKYLSIITLPFAAFLKHKNYDIIISWSMREGVCYGIVNRFFIKKKSPIHILRDFHINLTRNDLIYRIRLLLFRIAIPGVDFFLCTSTQEEEIYSKMFGIPRNKIRFHPDFPSEPLLKNYPFKQKDYIFAFGNSDRDFDTLIKAFSMIDKNEKLIILSQKYLPSNALPNNVSLINKRISDIELIEMICSCKIMVIPLQAYFIAAGQNSMFETMAMGRPMIITENMATKEYASNMLDACFYKAGDSNELAFYIKYLLKNNQFAKIMGKKAKYNAFCKFKRIIPDFIKIIELFLK